MLAAAHHNCLALSGSVQGARAMPKKRLLPVLEPDSDISAPPSPSPPPRKRFRTARSVDEMLSLLAPAQPLDEERIAIASFVCCELNTRGLQDQQSLYFSLQCPITRARLQQPLFVHTSRVHRAPFSAEAYMQICKQQEAYRCPPHFCIDISLTDVRKDVFFAKVLAQAPEAATGVHISRQGAAVQYVSSDAQASASDSDIN